ncbi:MAG TPA: adenylate/guanylate cyclase domain-containing protein [Candidatus Limnocylindria bacterium]|nr:adenylate/guanylate cyclase domain-containing protein [Candidatus Limnocylindria bacterium]
MQQSPAATVTFFFSDIQGSTRLLEALGAAYAEVLERHRRILRAEFATRGAVEVGTEGDSFFAVFADARSAVEAAVAIQRALATEDWSGGQPVRIRIGLHTGEAVLQGGDYVGLDVHRAARIMAAGHGGQIVISQATREAAGTLPMGVDVRDLGQHRLRDLSSHERLFQVVAEGLEAAFPPIRSVDAIPNNLPSQATELVGRQAELAAMREALDAPATRLVTLTGPGGVGKTRLAVQGAADRIHTFEDGAFFVDLAESRDVRSLLDAIVRAAGINVAAEANPRQAILDHLQSRAALLVLDNFEQVMHAAEVVSEILARCPRVKVLITSREALRLRGERHIPVAPLTLPAASPHLDAETAMRSDAVRLFVARAQEAAPGFRLTDDDAAAVADVCARLDGLPLAIELAAASLRLFTPAELRDRLSSQLEAIPGGPRDLPARQRTLRSTIEWSHELLTPEERRLFAVLSVFTSARVEAVQEVAARIPDLAQDDALGTLTALLDKSLIRREPVAGGLRFTMLETIRRYAAERLAEAPALAAAATLAHAEYYAELAASARGARHGAGARAAIDRLAEELGNLDAAWRYFIGHGDIGRLNVLVEVLWLVNEARGWYHRALGVAEDLLPVLAASGRDSASGDDELVLRLTLARGLLALRGYTPEVERLYREAVEISDAMDSSTARLPVLRSLATFYLYRGQLDRTVEMGKRMLRLAEESGDTRLELEGHMVAGPSTAFLGDFGAGLEHLRRVMELFDPDRHGSIPFRLGPSPGVAAPVVSAILRWWRGEPSTARKLVRRSAEMAERLGHPYSTAYGEFHAGVIDVWRRDYAGAGAHARRVLQVAQAHDYRIWIAVGQALDGLAQVALGDAVRGLARTEEGVEMYEGIHTPPVFWPVLLGLRANASQLAGHHADALRILETAAELETEDSPLRITFRVLRAEVLLATDRRPEAVAELRTASAEAEVASVPMLRVQALTGLVEAAGTEEAESREAARQLGDVLAGLDERDDEDFARARAVLSAQAGVAARGG